MQFREKQKLRRMYGVLERQFRRYYEMAANREGMTGTNLLVILESRLDSVVYRLGWGSSRAQARQLINHGHIDVNGRRCNIASALLKPGDTVTIHPSSRRSTYFTQLTEGWGDGADTGMVPSWLTLDLRDITGRMENYPSREEMDMRVNEQLVVEYYSR
jgi:small subunit ribosomal protein S4